MKKTALVLFLFLAAGPAFAATAWMDAAAREVHWFRPGQVTLGGQAFSPPTDEQLAEAFVVVEYPDGVERNDLVWGWAPEPFIRAMTQEELDARAAAEEEAAAQEAADAERPAEFENGIVVLNGLAFFPAVPGASNGWAVAVSPDGDLLTSHWYGSPTSTVSEIVADLSRKAVRQKEKKEAIRAAKVKGNGNQAILERLKALEAERGIE